MKTTEESRILKEYFLNACLLALALEVAQDLSHLERREKEDLATQFDEETPIAA